MTCPYGFDRALESNAKQNVDFKASLAKGTGGHRSKMTDCASPTDFITFLTKVTKDKTGPEMREFYIYLLDCFTDADIDLDGFIGAKEFDALVEKTAVAPRNFGFAPNASDLFMNEAERLASRADLFKTIDRLGTGLIAFPDFLRWATEHIHSKISRGAKPWKSGVGLLSLIQTDSAEDFTEFLKAATSSKSTPEYKDLYYHLLRCFTDADTTMTGVIDAEGFDKLIEIAAMAPRKYGFAPSAEGMFKSDAERRESRSKLFQKIDKDGGGTISFDEFLEWAFDHIKEKVKGGVSASYPPAAANVDSTSLEAKNLPIYDEASSPADFAAFCKEAVINKASTEYQKLYYHLLRCFSDADRSLSGRITAAEFDGLIDIAGAAPRKFGFAPAASEMFANVAERTAYRTKLFQQIDTDGSGEISFQEFLKWALDHVGAKVSAGVQTWVATPVQGGWIVTNPQTRASGGYPNKA
eukprot:TRINITY_DN2785_c0_g1_i5.p1 TRINITY_DN2785_c0_g1~~TRINITY_DN2785_c0_g1_i5.p1  ORF type:complete len:468 (-),score=95.32 TRINITY_DN2785_c0_g1_i5:359-1762(-)